MVDDSGRSLLAALLPVRCRGCDAPLVSGWLCRGCTQALPWSGTACARCAQPLPVIATSCAACQQHAPAFDAAWCAFALAAPIQHGIHRLKYHADFAQAELLGTLAATQAPPAQLLIPVPLHPLRLMRRGYNQAVELARVIGRARGIAVDPTAAQRVRATQDQIGQSAAARRRNMRGAFVVRRDLSGLHVALVDDVMTTGATLEELARACRRAGAARVDAWAIARTP